MKKQPHELTHEELIQLKELKQRRRVSTGDAPMLNAIYGRLTPGYTICETCVDTLAAEANSLIMFAEKQIGGSILNYEQSEDAEKAAAKAAKDAEKAAVKAAKDAEKAAAKAAKAGTDSSNTQNEPGKISIEEMNTDAIIALVLEKTGIELSEHAEREELIASAKDLLIGHIEEEAAPAAPASPEKVSLHVNGLVSTKTEVIYKFVKQETGTDLQEGLSRPDLLKAAAEALGREK